MKSPADVGFLPTDSLYKYLAISGIVLFGVSLYLAYSESTALEDRAGMLKVQLDEIGSDLASAREISRAYEQEAADLEMESKRLFSKVLQEPENRSREEQIILERDVARVTSRLESLGRSLFATQRQMEHGEEQSRNVVRASAELTLKIRRLEDVKAIARLGMILGAIIAIVGFSLWYLRLQRYQDRIIRREAERPRWR